MAKIFLAIGGLSTVVESCSGDIFTPKGSSDFVEDTDKGLSLLPVNIYLSNDVNVQGILSFAETAITDASFRTRFFENPETILHEFGLDCYDKDSPQIQLLLASGDPDVQKEIREGNFKGYLDVLERKDYLQSEFVQELTLALDKGIPIDTKAMEATYGCVLTLPVALAAAVVVVVAAAFSVASWAHIATSTDVVVSGASRSVMLSENAISLYIDESRDLGTIAFDEEEYVSEIREVIENSDIANNEDANQLFKIGCGTAQHLIENEE